MAGSKFAYVRNFELPDPLLPETFMVLRIDGHAFHRLSAEHDFAKPNDERALQLMDHAARDVMNEFKDIVLAFGESDEYSFLFRKSTTLYNRRESKILSTITSLFTSSYVFNWPKYLPDTPLKYCPSFDGRIVLYPSITAVRDYFSWRQADTHINNMYNTVFWALVLQGGQTTTEAHATLRGTVSATKHEIMFSKFGINYNDLPARFRKGSILVRTETEPGETQEPSAPSVVGPQVQTSKGKKEKKAKIRVRTTVDLVHCDIIGDEFWTSRPNIIVD
ncbi:tRNAHis guanylyltransferase [Trametes versicolor FP-101664 SS1]|uniref:tRNAHis guanylyltransferase n=1 Tax=Trametes versicolor (strain FP-101664) TaxID=717944 RepID=UPI00046249B1|nr:tRNAHis guanylyltransferase [Trametes versicolor FP-101664 SS1]EIW57505.1 tRNAHis guanylyltransferase [Trametes versicolor FP-101664 SS1]